MPSSNDINEDWATFKDQVNRLAQKYIPKRQSPNKTKKPQWITKKSIKAVKKKHSMYKRTIDLGRFKDLVAYAVARNQAVKACRYDKYLFEQDLVQSFKDNPKRFYSHLKHQQQTPTFPS